MMDYDYWIYKQWIYRQWIKIVNYEDGLQLVDYSQWIFR